MGSFAALALCVLLFSAFLFLARRRYRRAGQVVLTRQHTGRSAQSSARLRHLSHPWEERGSNDGATN